MLDRSNVRGADVHTVSTAEDFEAFDAMPQSYRRALAGAWHKFGCCDGAAEAMMSVPPHQFAEAVAYQDARLSIETNKSRADALPPGQPHPYARHVKT